MHVTFVYLESIKGYYKFYLEFDDYIKMKFAFIK